MDIDKESDVRYPFKLGLRALTLFADMVASNGLLPQIVRILPLPEFSFPIFLEVIPITVDAYIKGTKFLYAFIIPQVLTSTLVLGINYFVIITRPLHQLQVRKGSSSSCYMIETYNTHHWVPCH